MGGHLLAALREPPAYRGDVWVHTVKQCWNWMCSTLFVVLICMVQDASALTLRLQLQWIPQAQFAGYYVAQNLGWYEEAGLDVEILPHGPEFAPHRLLAEGQADIAVINLSEALQLIDSGVELVNLQQFKRTSTLVFVALASSNITSPSDLGRLRVARWDHFAAQSEAMFRRYDIKPDVVSQAASMAPLREGAVDVAMATRYNELVQLYLGGLDQDDVIVIALADHVTDLPEDGIYVRLDQWQAHQQPLREFVAITRRGWQYAFDHPEYAVNLVLRRARQAGVETNEAHQMLMLEVLRDLYLDESGQLHDGEMAYDVFVAAWQLLRHYDVIKGDDMPSFEHFYQR